MIDFGSGEENTQDESGASSRARNLKSGKKKSH